MRLKTIVAVLWGLLAGTLAFGQFGAGPQLPGLVPSSNPQALAVLSSVLGAAGGSALGSLQDFTASGAITYFWAGQQVAGTVTLRGKGLDEFRMDAVLPDGTRSWAVNHGVGNLMAEGGTETTIPGHNAANLGSLSFPFLWLAGATANSQTTISSEGAATVNGIQAIVIRVQRHYAASYDPSGLIAQLTTRDFFIDPTTLLILKMEIMTHPAKTFSVSLPEDLYFSNYQHVSGVLVPFSIEDTVNGQEIWSVQLSSIGFNSGLSDSVFSL
jgi:hypothetical protein